MSADPSMSPSSAPESAEPRGGAWKVLAILFALVAVALHVVGELLRLGSGVSDGHGHQLAFMMGGVLGVLIFPLLFVLVARILARPYTQRTFWKAYGIGMIFCAVGSFGTAVSNAGTMLRAKAEGQTAAAPEWTTYLSAAGGYSIDMPGVPERQEVTNGVGVRAIAQDTVFSASYFPADEVEMHPLEVFELVADGYRSRLEAEIEDSAIFHAGMVGRELQMTLPNGMRMRMRLYLEDGRLYETSVGGREIDPALSDRFLDSFALTAAEG